MDLELKLHREAIRKSELPHITRRLLEDHLGRQQYVHRIEITIMGNEFWLKGSAMPNETPNHIRTIFKIRAHMHKGKLLNLAHWEPVVYTHT